MPPPRNPFSEPTWFYNLNSGEIKHETNYFVRLFYLSQNGVWRGFDTQAQAQSYKAQHPPSHKSIFNPTNPNNPVHVPDPGGAISGIGSAASDVSGLVQALTQRSTWLRIGEGTLGLVLIAIGVAAMTKGTTAYNGVKSTAMKAAKFIK